MIEQSTGHMPVKKKKNWHLACMVLYIYIAIDTAFTWFIDQVTSERRCGNRYI